MKKEKATVWIELIGVVLVAIISISLLFIIIGWTGIKNQLITVICGLLAYSGTCFMGLVSLWQNKKIRENEANRNKPGIQVLVKEITTRPEIVNENNTMVYVAFRHSCGGNFRDLMVTKASAKYSGKTTDAQYLTSRMYSELTTDIIYLFAFHGFTYQPGNPITIDLEYLVVDEFGKEHPDTASLYLLAPSSHETVYILTH